MPQPRQYESRAAQQAAYRKGQRCSQQNLLAQKGLPAIPRQAIGTPFVKAGFALFKVVGPSM